MRSRWSAIPKWTETAVYPVLLLGFVAGSASCDSCETGPNRGTGNLAQLARPNLHLDCGRDHLSVRLDYDDEQGCYEVGPAVAAKVGERPMHLLERGGYHGSTRLTTPFCTGAEFVLLQDQGPIPEGDFEIVLSDESGALRYEAETCTSGGSTVFTARP